MDVSQRRCYLPERGSGRTLRWPERRNLDRYLHSHNQERAHAGLRSAGTTPAAIVRLAA